MPISDAKVVVGFQRDDVRGDVSSSILSTCSRVRPSVEVEENGVSLFVGDIGDEARKRSEAGGRDLKQDQEILSDRAVS